MPTKDITLGKHKSIRKRTWRLMGIQLLESGALESIASGSAHRGSQSYDPRGQSSFKAGNWTGQHHLCATGFSVMKKWRIERVHWVLFQSFRELPRPRDGWNHCKKFLIGHNTKLWRWSPSCNKKPGMLKGLEPWVICVRKLYSQQRGYLCHEKKHWRGRGNCLNSDGLFHQPGDWGFCWKIIFPSNIRSHTPESLTNMSSQTWTEQGRQQGHAKLPVKHKPYTKNYKRLKKVDLFQERAHNRLSCAKLYPW